MMIIIIIIICIIIIINFNAMSSYAARGVSKWSSLSTS